MQDLEKNFEGAHIKIAKKSLGVLNYRRKWTVTA